MKSKVYFALLGIALFYSTGVKAQTTYDLGLYLGGFNYYGEIGKKAFVSPNRPFFGVIGKMNFTERLSARATFTYASLHADDRNATDDFRGNGRGRDLYYSFDNTTLEAAVALEFIPFSFFKSSANPIDFYVYGGVGASYGDEMYYPLSLGGEDLEALKYGTRTRMILPFGAGFKTFVSSKFMLGLEVAPRYTSTDNLDGTEPDNESLEPNRFSYLAGNDWYTYVGITLTYRFSKGSNAYCDCTL